MNLLQYVVIADSVAVVAGVSAIFLLWRAVRECQRQIREIEGKPVVHHHIRIL